jgi:hypothetical protein
MKDRSLFHLLMSRLRSLSDGRPHDELAFARILRETLGVEQKGDWFSVTWRWQEKDYALHVPRGAFDFYRRGDTGQQTARQGVRSKNWQQAETLLRRIAEISGAPLPQNKQASSLSTLYFDETTAPTPQVLLILPGLLAALLTYFVVQVGAAIWTGVVAIALAYLNEYAWDNFPRRLGHWIEPVVIAGGAVAPGCFGITPVGPAVLAIGLTLFVRAEREGTRATTIDWCAAGAATGAIVFVLGKLGFVPVMLLAAVVLLAGFAQPNRIRPTLAVAAAVAAFSVAAIAMLLPTELASGATIGANLASWIAWPIILVFALCFLSGLVFGQHFLLLPWLGHAIIAITCGSLVLAGSGSQAAAFAAFMGFGICIVARLAFSLVMARRLTVH